MLLLLIRSQTSKVLSLRARAHTHTHTHHTGTNMHIHTSPKCTFIFSNWNSESKACVIEKKIITWICYDVGYTTKIWYFHKPSPNTGRCQIVAGRCLSLTKGKRKGTMKHAEGMEEIDHIHERKWHIVGDSSESFLQRNKYSLPFPSTIGHTHELCAVGLSVWGDFALLRA